MADPNRITRQDVEGVESTYNSVHKAIADQYRLISTGSTDDKSLFRDHLTAPFSPPLRSSSATQAIDYSLGRRVSAEDVLPRAHESRVDHLKRELTEISKAYEKGKEIPEDDRTPLQQAEFEASEKLLQESVGMIDTLATDLQDQPGFDQSAQTRLAALRAFANSPGALAAIAADKAARRTAASEKPEDRSRTVRFARQCWLLYNMEVFANEHKKKLGAAANAVGTIGYAGYTAKAGMIDWSTRSRIMLAHEEVNGSTLINKLNFRKGTPDFVNIRSYEYAQLMPTFRIFKIYNHRSPKERVELEFANHTNLDGIANALTIDQIGYKESGKFIKGAEAGVESFEWRILGTDPYTATRDIEATLKMYVQDFSTMVKTRKGPVTRPGKAVTPDKKDYKYIDLLALPECLDDDTLAECHEILVEVGYAPIAGKTIMSEGVKDNISCQKDSLYLVLTDHSFEFKEDGTLSITINYRGRLENVMKSRKMNILLPAAGSHAANIRFKPAEETNTYNFLEAEIELKRLKRLPKKTELDKKRIEHIGKAIKGQYFKYKQVIVSGIVSRMDGEKLIHRMRIPAADYEAFLSFQADLPASTYPVKLSKPDLDAGLVLGDDPFMGLTAAASDQADLNKYIDALGKELGQNSAIDQRTVDFFYLGDLLGCVLDQLTGDNVSGHFFETTAWYKRLFGAGSGTIRPGGSRFVIGDDLYNFRMILGNATVTFKPAAAGTPGDPVSINLAHLPISLEAYNNFVNNNILAKDRTNYPFFTFVDDLLSELVGDLLGSDCFGGLIDSNIRAKTQILTTAIPLPSKFYGQKKGQEYNTVNLGDEFDPDDPPFFSKCSDFADKSDLYQYFVVTLEENDPAVLEGKYKEDLNNGIIHLEFGAEAGLIRNIKFQKTDQEFLPEARFASEGNFVFNQLANVYDITAELVGNNLFKVGQYVYIDASNFGAGPSWATNATGTKRSWANLMGLGGYHLVTEIGSSISRDGFNTSIKARWVSGGYREGQLTVHAPSPGPSPEEKAAAEQRARAKRARDEAFAEALGREFGTDAAGVSCTERTVDGRKKIDCQ